MSDINLIKKYNNLPKPARASFWFLISGILQKVISLITTPIFTRILSAADYGKYSVYISWFTIISIFLTLNISSGAYMKGLMKYQDDRKVFTSSIQGLITTIIFFGSILFLILKSYFEKAFGFSITLIFAMVIDILMMSTYRIWSTQQRIDYEYKKLIVLTILKVFLSQLIAILAIIFLDYKFEARVYSIIVVDLLLFSGLLYKQFKDGKVFFNKAYWKFALFFSIPLIPHYLSQIVLNQSDRIIIDQICGPIEAGIYSVAYSLSMVMIIINNAILNTLNPWFYKKIKSNEIGEIPSVSYLLLVLVAFFNFMLILIAPEVMSIMAPPEYYKAIWVIPPITSSAYFIFMYSLFANFEFYFEKTIFIMIASVLSAIMNVVSNYVFIRLFGFVAAGYTTLGCYVLYAFGHYLFMKNVTKKHLNEKRIYSGKKIVGISFVFIFLNGVALLLYNNQLLRYSYLVILLLFAYRMRSKYVDLFKKVKS